jgi:hypothetical protein
MMTMKNIHNFSGLTNFYRKFMLGFSHIAFPLIQVTKGVDKTKFAWSESQQKGL